MFFRTAPAAIAATCVAATLATAQPQTFTSGEFRLAGAYADGRATEVELEIEAKQGRVEVERKANRDGEELRWKADASRVEARRLVVTFSVPAGNGVTNLIEATYVLDSAGRAISEELRNLTQLGPEAGWSSLQTQGRRRLSKLSYGELARETVPPLFEALTRELGGFDAQTLPHEAKALRKQIGKVRLLVDLFSYAYPRGRAFDPWADLREALDEGYEAMGSFKDLYDAQGVSDPSQAVYDAAELSAARAPVLAWQRAFTRPSQLGYYTHYLSNPKKTRLYERDDLSPYYWGVQGTEPRRDLSGIENLARLQRALLDSARDTLRDVARIKDDELVDHDEQEHFHDFRKALRSTVKISEFFPEVYEAGVDPSAALDFVDGIVGRYGDLNDLLVAHTLAEKRGRDGKARDLADRIEAEWDALKKWQSAQDAGDRIRDLRRLVRH